MMGNHGPMGGSHTAQVCITQEQIDKFGTVPPQTHGDCNVTNVVKKAHGVTAEMNCTGAMKGKGTLEANWTDDTHSTSKLHFLGEMQMGSNSRPVEWTVESHSTFKGSDCGNVKPIEVPSSK